MPADELLEFLIQKTEETKLGHGITLFVNGVVISGFMIRSEVYYNMMSTYFEGDNYEILDPNRQKHKERAWEDYKRDYKQCIKDITSRAEDRENEYVYLKDVTVLTAGHECNLFLWKGRVSSIDGFSLGLISKGVSTRSRKSRRSRK